VRFAGFESILSNTSAEGGAIRRQFHQGLLEGRYDTTIDHRSSFIRYTMSLSNLDRRETRNTVSHKPKMGNKRIQTLAYKESTTFPTCSNVSIAAP
jgi:hypothetical protein